MLTSDGYSLIYDKNSNKIAILLPQTWETLTNTCDPIVDRRTDVTETDLWALLNVAQLIFHKGVRKDDERSYQQTGGD